MTARAMVLLGLLAAGWPAGQARAGQGPGDVLLQADRRFARDTVEAGVAGWVSWFAPSGVMARGEDPPLVGRQAIRGFMTPLFARPSFSLRWQPTRAEIQVPGRLGTTTGRFTRRWKDEHGREVVERGTYLIVWQKQPDGTWKVAFDIGTLD